MFADPVAAARVLALTSSRPRLSSAASPTLPCPPGRLDRPLTLKMAPLDLTHGHNFTPSAFRAAIQPRLSAGSPVAELVSTVVEHTFDTIRALRLARQGREAVEGEEEMSLHDPLLVPREQTGNMGEDEEEGEGTRLDDNSATSEPKAEVQPGAQQPR